MTERDAARGEATEALGAEVANALAAGRPVVALESTIIAHGLPRPRNYDVAVELEDLLRGEGVTPATVALIDGTPRIGLASGELRRLAFDEEVAKLSVRDLPMAMALGRAGATTVAATAHLAGLAGIQLFATGGIGGVHREADRSWDESADLAALARTRITVVCAGAKSILDIPATLERLESYNIGVVGYRTTRFPGFYVTDSGFDLDWSVESADEVATIMRARESLAGMESALLVANPLPVAEQLDPRLHEAALHDSLAAAKAAGVRGKDVTPFLLARFQQATGGEALEANIRAVRNNVRLAAAIARAWSSAWPSD